MGTTITDSEQSSFYQAALAGLRFVEARRASGQRFGDSADLRWKAFAGGGLTAADRLDLLIRDADAEWRGAFGARTVFDLAGVAEDEAFGPRWQALDPRDGEDLWRSQPGDGGSPTTPALALQAIAHAWGLSLSPFEVPNIDPAAKVWVAGPAAIAALACAFVEGKDLDWGAQVTVVASPPAHRQLAALATAVADSARCPSIHVAERAGAPAAGAIRLVSDDATAADRAALECEAG